MDSVRRTALSALIVVIAANLNGPTVAGTFQKTIGMGEMVKLNHSRRSMRFHKVAVAADNEACSEAGVQILRMNGNAVDAAAATLLCLGVVHPHSSGIGGGGFMLVYWRSNKTSHVFDFRETAPHSAYSGMYHGNATLSAEGGLSIAVPGELKGIEEAWRRFGQLKWSDLFQPAIKIAKEGFRVSKSLCIALNRQAHHIFENKHLRNIFTKNGVLVSDGTIVKNPDLAETLSSIAASGSSASFYTGRFAALMVSEINQAGGNFTLNDFLQYKVLSREPLETELGALKMITVPPPASGPVLALILNILKGFNVSSSSDQGLVYHRFVEAFKFAYAYRSNLADPMFSETVNETVKKMVDDKFANRLRSLINDSATMPPSFYGPQPTMPVKPGTTHFVVVDKDGNAVSVTSTVNLLFGSNLMSRLGFIYNNEMDDFSAPNITNNFGVRPSEVNYIKPGKRPQSSSAPTLFTDANGNVVMAIGGSGGTIITTAIATDVQSVDDDDVTDLDQQRMASTIFNHVILGRSLKEAVETPRVHSQLYPDLVYAEQDVPAAVIEQLKKRGHKVKMDDVNHAVVQAIARLDEDDEWLHHSYRKGVIISAKNELFAVSDRRKGGIPAGF